MQEAQPEVEVKEISYYHRRMTELGVTEENNVIDIWQTEVMSGATQGDTVLKPFPIFTETTKGIDILVYTINRNILRYAKENQRHKNHIYKITRLYPELVKKDGSIQKYSMPKGQPAMPFIPPGVVQSFDAATDWLKSNPGKKLPKELRISALYLTEGFFKAWKADQCNIACIGLPSITCLKDSETGELHADIQKLIIRCEVERVVWLVDGDCRNITGKEITDGIDLYKRPKQFFNTVAAFNELMSKFDDVQKYFAHINSDELTGTPKGLDDLLCAMPDDVADIASEFADFSKIPGKGTNSGKYLVRINISFNLMRINNYFFLNDVDQFYLYHSEKRADLKTAKNFKYNGTLYRYEESEGKCVVEVPSSAANYFRADDDYYQFIDVPNRYGNIVRQFHRRSKATIKDDNPAKDFFKHVPKYQTFCVVPDHLNYQRVINNCFNMYAPFMHEPEEGDCTVTLDFIKHIFGEVDVPFTDENGKTGTIKRYELGLDYLTILYKRPQQILPILCLVSSQRQTGKTLFAKWLNQIYSENMAIVGNEDLQNPFNSHWAGKLIICCDETKIDKQVVIEKVKSLSTSTQVMMNAKGRDQISMEFFGKFIFLTNNEDNFINIDEEEIRFWIVQVPVVSKRNVNLLEDMLEEIPAFLQYLNKRQMVTTYKERHWFDTQLLQTEALSKIKANSIPTAEKRVRIELKEWFEFTGMAVLTFPLDYFCKEVVRGLEKTYVVKILHKMGYKSKSGRISYPKKVEKVAADSVVGQPAQMEVVFEMLKANTTHYEFEREKFTDVPIEAAPDNTKELPF